MLKPYKKIQTYCESREKKEEKKYGKNILSGCCEWK